MTAMPIDPRRLSPEQRNTVSARLRKAARQYRSQANRLFEAKVYQYHAAAQDREALADLFETMPCPYPDLDVPNDDTGRFVFACRPPPMTSTAQMCLEASGL